VKPLLAAVLIALLAVAAGCGDEKAKQTTTIEPPAFGELLRRIPATESHAYALDVAAARRGIGLPANAAPAPPSGGTDGARRLRALIAATVPSYPVRDNGPFERAVDYGRVTGIMRFDGPPEVVVIATREPWDELRARLGRNGWRPGKYGVLVQEDRGSGRLLDYVSGGDDGLLVATGSLESALAVRSSKHTPSNELRALMQALPGPARAARVGGPGCVQGVGVGYSPGEAKGIFAVDVFGTVPRVRRLRVRAAGGPLAGYALLAPQAAGGRIQVPFVREVSSDPSELASATAPSWFDAFTYSCSRDARARGR
jgi:hypothetical protein